jgi:hypothetical protein
MVKLSYYYYYYYYRVDEADIPEKENPTVLVFTVGCRTLNDATCCALSIPHYLETTRLP